jgi:class 3 adenylate cyclase
MPSVRVSSSRFTLGVKLSLFAALLVAGVGAATGYFLVIRARDQARQLAENRFRSLASVVAGMRGQGYGGRQFDPLLVRMLVELSGELGTELCFAVFQNEKGQAEEGSVNPHLLRAASPALAARIERLAPQEQLEQIAAWTQPDLYLRTYRVELKGNEGNLLGKALLGFSTRAGEEQMRRHLLVSLILTLVAVLAGVGGSLLLARHFSRPIRSLAQAMQAVAVGDLNQELEPSSKDEIGTLTTSFNVMTQGLRERERIRSTLARYVSDQVAERILRQQSAGDLAGELKAVTVMFLDIRGFTTLTEMLPPREVVKLLNDYFGMVIDIIFRYDGTINKFIGDSILAIYGAPQNVDYPQLRAVLTAAEIQQRVGEFNWERLQQGQPAVNFGIGIHSGTAIAGNIGSARRTEYTVIGRDVNIAARIQSVAREGQILISEASYRQVGGLIKAQRLPPVELKGILEPVTLYEVQQLLVSSIEEARKKQGA